MKKIATESFDTIIIIKYEVLEVFIVFISKNLCVIAQFLILSLIIVNIEFTQIKKEPLFIFE